MYLHLQPCPLTSQSLTESICTSHFRRYVVQIEHSQHIHKVLGTLLAEVAVMINARLLVLLSANPDMPAILAQAIVLNQKTNAAFVPQAKF